MAQEQDTLTLQEAVTHISDIMRGVLQLQIPTLLSDMILKLLSGIIILLSEQIRVMLHRAVNASVTETLNIMLHSDTNHYQKSHQVNTMLQSVRVLWVI